MAVAGANATLNNDDFEEGRSNRVPNRSKIVDEGELVRWIEDGWTYRAMQEEYLRKYHLEVSIAMFSNFRRRKGLDSRIVRDKDLTPWDVHPQHRFHWAARMLRAEARERAGHELSDQDSDALNGFKRTLEREDAVVHYDGDTDQGFFLVPRRAGVDTDLVRVPAKEGDQARRLA